MSTVLQITPYYPPHLGGVERVVENLATELARRHDVRVLTTTAGRGAAPRRSREGGVTVVRHRCLELAHTPLAPGLLGSLTVAPRAAIWHLHCAHAALPEMVAVAALARRRPFLVHFHLDVDATGRLGRLLPAYKRHVFGRVLRAAAGVIVLTAHQADFVRRRYRVRAERLFVVPNAVSDRYFLGPRQPRSPEHGPVRLLFVGRLTPQKNVGRLLEAMRLVSEPVHLTIVGLGEREAVLRGRAHELGLREVTFAGARHGADLVREYADADVFVLPSDKEGMPLAALEAMAASLPIVATDVPGNRELLDDVALLAKPEPISLAACLDTVAGDPSLCQLLGERGAQAARAHTWAAVARQVEAVYGEVLA